MISSGATWGYTIASCYLMLGVLWLLTVRLNQAWFLDLLERIEEMEPGFRAGAFDTAMKLGSNPEEIELKANVIMLLGWPVFVFCYAFMYLAVRKFEKWNNLHDYMEEKREQVLEAWNLVEDTPEAKASKEEIVWAAESNLRAADAHFQKKMRVRWWQHVAYWIRYRQRMHFVGGGIFSYDPVENLRRARQIENEHLEDSMVKFDSVRERRPFRLDFDDTGRVGKFIVQQPSKDEAGNTTVADCCLDCAQSDQMAQVMDASDNAKHLLVDNNGYVPARGGFLARDTKVVFTTDGKAGFVSGVLMRDLC